MSEPGSGSAGAAIFQDSCYKCHGRVAPSEALAPAPSLDNVVNRKIASVAGFRYSKALKNKKNLTWNEETLFQYLAAPKRFIPNTTMNHPGISNPDQRKALIAYLKQH